MAFLTLALRQVLVLLVIVGSFASADDLTPKTAANAKPAKSKFQIACGKDILKCKYTSTQEAVHKCLLQAGGENTLSASCTEFISNHQKHPDSNRAVAGSNTQSSTSQSSTLPSGPGAPSVPLRHGGAVIKSTGAQ